MFKLAVKVPSEVAIATSGGIDSMVALDFVRRSKKVKVTALHFNHKTGPYAEEAENLVKEYCAKYQIDLRLGVLNKEVPSGVSKEAFWRTERYSFFSEFKGPIITAHHLDDAVETWIFSSMHGRPFLIPAQRDNFIRPFIINRKSKFKSWALDKEVPYIEDPSNKEIEYTRNFIRNELMPGILRINPGIHKTIKKKYLD
jgi:tRNA(Ile)-lysidine synthase